MDLLLDIKNVMMADIEGGAIANLQIDTTDLMAVEKVKNLYKVILTHCAFERPYIDEKNSKQ